MPPCVRWPRWVPVTFGPATRMMEPTASPCRHPVVKREMRTAVSIRHRHPEVIPLWAGTSFAHAPHVAGLAALLFSAKPSRKSGCSLHQGHGQQYRRHQCSLLGADGYWTHQRFRAALEHVAGQATKHTCIATAGAQRCPGSSAGVGRWPKGGSCRFLFVPDPVTKSPMSSWTAARSAHPPAHTLIGVSADHTLVISFAERPTPPGCGEYRAPGHR